MTNLTNQELLKKKQQLTALWGQFVDLERGFLDEIVIKKGQSSKLLRRIIVDAIMDINNDELKKDAE